MYIQIISRLFTVIPNGRNRFNLFLAVSASLEKAASSFVRVGE